MPVKASSGSGAKKSENRQRKKLEPMWGMLARPKGSELKGLKRESLKRGRYSGYYSAGDVPVSFLSMAEEKARGSSPGRFLQLIEKAGVKVPRAGISRVPQIMLVQKGDIARFLLGRMKNSSTPAGRAFIDSFIGATRASAISGIRSRLAEIDWAEQTYGIQIEVDPELLRWLGKVRG